MVDYFTAAQMGNGGQADRLPVGVINGVTYYDLASFQAAQQRQRDAEASARRSRMANVPTGTYSTSYGPQNRAAANPSGARADAVAAQNTGANIPAGAYSTSYGGGNFINDTNAAGANAPERFTGAAGAMVPQGAYSTSYGGGNFIDDTNAAGPNAQRSQRIAAQNTGAAVPDNTFSTSFGPQENVPVRVGAQGPLANPQGASPVDLYSMANDGVAEAQRLQNRQDAVSNIPANAYSTSYGTQYVDPVRVGAMGTVPNAQGASPVDLYSMANDGTPEAMATQEAANTVAPGQGQYVTSYGVQDRAAADVAVNNVMQNAPASSSLAPIQTQVELAKEAEEDAKKAQIDAARNLRLTEQYEAAQEEAAAAKTAEGEAAAGAAGMDLTQANQDAYQRNLANILESIEMRKQAAGESYSDLYQQMMAERTASRGLTDPNRLTGGMARQQEARQTAAEIGAMTDLASQRQRAIDTIEAEKMSAELEAGRMTAEQFELNKQTNPMWLQGELLAQKYGETGDINDFNAYMTHMAGLLGVEPSLASINDPEAMRASVSASVESKVRQYIENPTLMQQITGFGTGGIMTGLGAVMGTKALTAIGTAYVGKGLAAAFGAKAAGVTIAGLAGAAAPVVGAVLAGALVVMGISSIAANIRRSKSGEAAAEAVDNLLASEKERIMGQGFTEAEADEAIAALRQQLPTAYQQ